MKMVLPLFNMAPIISSGFVVEDLSTDSLSNSINHNKNGYIQYKDNEIFLKKLTRTLNSKNTYIGPLFLHKDLKTIKFEEVFGMVNFDWMLNLFHNMKCFEICDTLYHRFVEKSNLSLKDVYRKKDFHFSLYIIEKYWNEYPRDTKISHKRIHASIAKYYYLTGNKHKARFYLRKTECSLKNLGYFFSTYFGYKYILKKFDIFR